MSSAIAARPDQIDPTDWNELAPLYQVLIDRPLRCAGCLEQLILDRSELDARVNEAEANLFIAMTCHTDDAAAQSAYTRFVERVEPELRRAGFALDRRIAESPFRGDLDQERFGVLLRDTGVDVALYREANLAIQTELTTLDQEYSQIVGAMTISVDGTERTIPQMVGELERTDRSIREAAWRAIFERRYADHERIDQIFSRMVALRNRMAQNADEADFRDFQHRKLRRFDYTPADCGTFHHAAETVCVPLMRALDRERAATLGLERLRPWDLAVDVHGRAPLRPFTTAEELVAGTSRIFHRLRPSLGGLFDELRGGGCLDLESRKGKAPGGYQYQRQWSRTPFIFMNAAGLHRDLITMVHEAGHAFHSLLSRDEPLLHYRNSPMEFAEVASMSMELLTLGVLEEFYAAPEAERARRTLLEELPGKLAWIAQIDSFQHWIYTHPEHSTAEREAEWLSLETRFGRELDWSGFESWQRSSWQRQLHLFGVPFYYIEYGIAQLGALQLWGQFRRDPAAALDHYEAGLSLGGSKPLPRLFEATGLRFDFGAAIVRELLAEVAKELGVGRQG